MKLQYKISIIMMIVSLLILTSISYIYSEWSYQSVIENEKKSLTSAAIDSALHIENELLDNLSNVKTMGSAPVVIESLQKSNLEYDLLDNKQKTEHITKLNNRWKRAKSTDDSFIKPYMNNPLAHYLKKQQSVLDGVYGEIFITNRYGAMIATTGKLSTLAHSHKYWFKESYFDGEGKIFFDDRGFDTSVGGYVVGIVVPIKDDGKIIGILKANINIIGTLSRVINNYNNTNHGTLKIVRTKGKVVYEKDVVPLSTNVNPEIMTSLKNLETGSSLLKDSTQNYIIAYAPVRLSLDSEAAIFGGKTGAVDHVQGNDGEIWHTVVSYDQQKALFQSKEINKLIIYIGFLAALLSAIVAFFIGRWISKPIDELTEVFHSIADGNYDLRAEVTSKNEVGALAKSFNYMLDELNKTTASRDELRQEIQKREEAQAELNQQEEIMIAQSRHAAMGEMVSMLAHQWRQPIAAISMGANNILADIELESIDEKTLKNGAKDIIIKTKELSRTIDDFRSFFKQEKITQEITATEVIRDSIGVIGKSIENNSINIIKDIKSEKKVNTYSKELMQVIINILKNSKEAIEINNTEIREIKISAYDEYDNLIIKICDSGSGISEDIMEKIFDPYFTTKGVTSGVGLGLYMSKVIVEKHLCGKIKCSNENDGVCFELIVPTSLKE